MSLKHFALPVLLHMSLLGTCAQACPFCDGGPKGVNPVREAIIGPTFWSDLFSVLSPFGIMVPIAAMIHHGPPKWIQAKDSQHAKTT